MVEPFTSKGINHTDSHNPIFQAVANANADAFILQEPTVSSNVTHMDIEELNEIEFEASNFCLSINAYNPTVLPTG